MILDKEIILDSVMLRRSPRFKKQIYQFLPECLLEISISKNFQYKDQKLKSSYIVDIIHSLLLKYYFKSENQFSLSSVILKDKYGYLYNYYIDYLKEHNIIKLKKNYLKGSNSRIYSLNDHIINGKIFRYQNTDKILLKKYYTKHIQLELDRNNIIEKEIKKKLISDLYSVEIQFDRSIFYLDSLKDEDSDIYNRNKYSVESINQKNIFYHFDSYGRMHTNFTILKSFIRKNCLLIDGEETFEKDLKNSQPLMIYKLIKESGSSIVKSDELELFGILVKGGNYYQYLIDKLNLENKNCAKHLTYQVFFGRNHSKSKHDKFFKFLFPSIHNYITAYKKEFGDYKSLAYTLQKMESSLIFNKIVKTISKIDPEIKLITIHDSVICKYRDRDLVSQTFEEIVRNEFYNIK
jgi:hypothetical protein